MKYLIGQDCPDFVSPALIENGVFKAALRLRDRIAGRFSVIFFYPLDFNYISLTELLSLQARLSEFEELNVSVIAISSDSHLAHQAWQLMLKAESGLGNLGLPLIADMTHHVAKLFDVLVAEAMPEAATIIVDPDNKIIFQMRHDTSVGRNIDRILEAIRIYQDSGSAPTSPIEQILLVEESAPNLYRLGYKIVAQSMDTDLDHPQWNRLPRDEKGRPQLSFPFLAQEQEWPKHPGMTVAVREGLNFHSTGLLLPDGQLLFEFHADRQIPRDFSELLRIADAVKRHVETGEVIPWETKT